MTDYSDLVVLAASPDYHARMSATTQGLPVLYSFRRCPYAMRARLAIAVAEQNVQLREVSLSNKPAEMLRASPKGTVPVLVLSDGKVIDESYDIMKWALRRHDPEHWLDIDLDTADEWVRRNDQEFKPKLDGYKYSEYHPEHTATQWRDEAAKFLSELDARLNAKACLLGEKISIVDAALMPFIRQFALVDKTWFSASHQAVDHWLRSLIDSPLFQSVMHKYPLWSAGDAPIKFGGPS